MQEKIHNKLKDDLISQNNLQSSTPKHTCTFFTHKNLETPTDKALFILSYSSSTTTSNELNNVTINCIRNQFMSWSITMPPPMGTVAGFVS